jgi:hypothetical protein
MHGARERRRPDGGSPTRTTQVLGGLVVLAVCAAVIGGSNVAAHHASPTAPAAKNPPWLVRNSALAGKVLHWREHSYIWSPGTVDPANGKLIIGDVWMQLNSNGDPIFVHLRSTYPDGTSIRRTTSPRRSPSRWKAMIMLRVPRLQVLPGIHNPQPGV